MRRLHLFEFGDQPWFPRILREGETAYLVAAYRLVPVARDWAEIILSALHPGDGMEIFDLCSGCGGAMPLLIDGLDRRGCKSIRYTYRLVPTFESGCAPSPIVAVGTA